MEIKLYPTVKSNISKFFVGTSKKYINTSNKNPEIIYFINENIYHLYKLDDIDFQ